MGTKKHTAAADLPEADLQRSALTQYNSLNIRLLVPPPTNLGAVIEEIAGTKVM